MTIRQLAQRSAVRALGLATDLTMFGKGRWVRTLGFDVLRTKQSLVLCASPAKETFVVSSRDMVIGRQLFVNGEFDFDKFDAAWTLVLKHRNGRRPKVLIDVGANIGPICIPAVARGYVETAVAIEPDPENCRLLKANLELNLLKPRVRVHEMAAGPADNESLQLELSEYNLGDHRIRAPNVAMEAAPADRQVVTVRSTKLDTICSNELDEDLLVWMDVQGFEGFALAGAGALLARRVPLVLEFWPGGMARTGSFPLVKSSLAGYDSFLDLAEPGRVRPIAQMQALYDEIGDGNASTDILVI